MKIPPNVTVIVTGTSAWELPEDTYISQVRVPDPDPLSHRYVDIRPTVKGDGSVWRVQVQIAEPTPFGSPWGAWAEEDFTDLNEAVAWARKKLSTSLIKTGKLD